MATIPKGSLDARSTEDLLAAARAGCGNALGTLLQSVRTYLLVIGEREVRSDLRVKVSPSDLVQETFAEGQRLMRGFTGNTTPELRAWLRAILLNKIAAARRRYLYTDARKLSREEPPANRSSIIDQAELLIDDETPSKAAMRQEDAQVVRAAIEQLPAHYRRVIQLRNFDALPFADIAGLMHCSEHNSRALWVRAMRRLKEELDGLDAQQ